MIFMEAIKLISEASEPLAGAQIRSGLWGGGGGGDSDTFFSERHLRRKSRKSPNPHHEHF